MKFVRFLLLGVFFGIVLTKSEVISWYRIQEMFRFQGFHMYGVLGSAVLTGMLINMLIRKSGINNIQGNPIPFPQKQKGFIRYMAGGIIFGMGWALTGACPGPVYILIGNGYLSFIIVLISALLGTLTYGYLRDRLPH